MPIDRVQQLLKRRRTRIVATLGPASSEAATIRHLIQSGANAFRLNMSHGDRDTHRRTYECVRSAAAMTGEAVAVMADLGGPKIRVGRFEAGQVTLVAGEHVTITTRDVQGSALLIPSQYAGLTDDIRPGHRILLDDGQLELRAEDVGDTEIRCVVVQGGILRDRKGMNLPGVRVSAPSLTDRDRDDALFAAGLGVEYLALSFVREAADVYQLRALVAGVPRPPGIIAKIERPEALDDIDAVLDAADGIMIARGDLGVELDPALVPMAQTQLVDLARARAKPVIVATQMLESMIDRPRPTRAEVSDVSNAVRSGADAIMLSGETASGSFPVEAVAMMERIARETEAYLWTSGAFGTIAAAAEAAAAKPPIRLEDAVARATGRLSRDLMVRAIVVPSRLGQTAAMVSSARPQAPVVAASDDARTCRRMSLLWGVIAVQVETADLVDPHALCRRLALDLDLASPGDHVLQVRGYSVRAEDNATSITVLVV